jgi:hypothetical protein
MKDKNIKRPGPQVCDVPNAMELKVSTATTILLAFHAMNGQHGADKSLLLGCHCMVHKKVNLLALSSFFSFLSFPSPIPGRISIL